MGKNFLIPIILIISLTLVSCGLKKGAGSSSSGTTAATTSSNGSTSGGSGGGGGTLTVNAAATTANPVNLMSSGAGATARIGHTLTKLSDGRVLIVGGCTIDADYTTAMSSVYIYNPDDGSFTATGSLGSARCYHQAVYMTNVNKVLVSGGYLTSTAVTATAEVYDVAAGTWSAAGSIIAGARVWHTMTYIPSIAKVLVAGGSAAATSAQSNTELYDPVANTWATTTGALDRRFQGHGAVLLNTGNVLIGGGTSQILTRPPPPTPGGDVNFSLFNPSTQTWSAAASSPTSHSSGEALLKAQDGKVYIYSDCSGAFCSGATSAYDPVANTWAAKNTFATSEWQIGAAVTQGDIFFRIGGTDSSAVAQSDVLTYAKSTDTWAAASFTFPSVTRETRAITTHAGIFAFGGMDTAGAAHNTYILYKPYNSIQITASGGTAPYTYAVTSGTGAIAPSSGVLYPGAPSTITVTVTDSVSATGTVNITVN